MTMNTTPEEFESLLRQKGYARPTAKRGLDIGSFAKEIGYTYQAVWSWLDGTNPIPKWAVDILSSKETVMEGS